MKNSGLTEKHMLNRHFRKTEHIILIAYYRLRDYPSAKKLAKLAKISRSTLYRHHHNIWKIPDDYETYLLVIYQRVINPYILKKDFSFKGYYFRTLIFISNHKEAFFLLFIEGHKDIVKKMLDALKPRISAIYHISGRNLDKIYSIYSNEILGLIENWGRQRFTLSMLNEILNDAIILTEDITNHLVLSLRIGGTTTVNQADPGKF